MQPNATRSGAKPDQVSPHGRDYGPLALFGRTEEDVEAFLRYLVDIVEDNGQRRVGTLATFSGFQARLEANDFTYDQRWWFKSLCNCCVSDSMSYIPLHSDHSNRIKMTDSGSLSALNAILNCTFQVVEHVVRRYHIMSSQDTWVAGEISDSGGVKRKHRRK